MNMSKRPRVESDLYDPVKAFLERQGFVVKGEVRGCDLVAIRGDEPPLIVELKRGLTLGLLIQGVNRLAMTDNVYLAVPRPNGRYKPTLSPYHRDVRKLCRRLGLGLMTVAWDGRATLPVEVVLDPLPYRPRANKRRAALLLREHVRRIGDPNRGGISRRPIVTAYRQEALHCAALIERHGSQPIAALRRLGAAPNAGRIMLHNYYGWFERLRRGVYGLTAEGRAALVTHGAALAPEIGAGQGLAAAAPASMERKPRHTGARVVSSGRPA